MREKINKTLRIFGLLIEVEEESQLGFHEMFFKYSVFSEKMYRFVSWLDYHEKFGLEPLYELIEFQPNVA